MERVLEHRWPGNVRELENLLERVIVSADSPILEIDEGLLHEGLRVGSYRLIDRLGAGGMGEVWLGKHQLLARPAAVKLINTEALSKLGHETVFVERFKREAATTAQLRSPHTVELYDFGVTDDGAFYYVMELLIGMDLSTMVERFGPLPPERVVALLLQACRSLGEAHTAGLVHRDVKPSNLFACKLGEDFDFLKVLDFGMVKSLQSEHDMTLTQQGLAMGSPSFMAPEQVEQDLAMDGRADLYGLGCAAYWMLTGKLVFEAPNPVQMLMKHTQATPKPPSESAPVPIPQALDDLVLACLAKKPEARPANAHQLAEQLDAIECDEAWTYARARTWWTERLPDESAATAAREPTANAPTLPLPSDDGEAEAGSA